jgi:lipoprotein-anchoring transpeptidase ErfK/SrfK
VRHDGLVPVRPLARLLWTVHAYALKLSMVVVDGRAIGRLIRIRYWIVTLLALAVTAPAAAHAPARQSCTAGAHAALGTQRVAYAAVARGRTMAYRAPGRGAFVRFARENANGYPTVFSVVGKVVGPRCLATWFHVELPVRPNGATGWVRARDVQLQYVTTKIVVDVSARRLELYRGSRLVLRTRAAVGATGTPTPTGRYYVNQRLVPRDAGGPFGPAALGVSAFSDVLTGWAQGGPIGIHGTNEPWSIGRAVSNGCIRVPNAVMRRLFAAVPAGTPVLIRA